MAKFSPTKFDSVFDSLSTYSFSSTYCIKSRLILYIPGQQADIGQLRVHMAFEILDQKIK